MEENMRDRFLAELRDVVYWDVELIECDTGHHVTLSTCAHDAINVLALAARSHFGSHYGDMQALTASARMAFRVAFSQFIRGIIASLERTW